MTQVDQMMRAIHDLAPDREYPLQLTYADGKDWAMYEPDMASIVEGQGESPEQALRSLAAALRLDMSGEFWVEEQNRDEKTN